MRTCIWTSVPDEKELNRNRHGGSVGGRGRGSRLKHRTHKRVSFFLSMNQVYKCVITYGRGKDTK